MWFEARKQERKIRSVMIDHKRRQERRRNFYERIRKDPTDFMQLHGRRCKIYVDPSIAQAADNAAILRPWQGDPQVLIDRFDARSHLDTIVEYNGEGESRHVITDPEEQREERRANYERYRILILNDFDKTSEEKYLKQIYMAEYLGGLPAHQEERKKKPAEQKAAIAYTYEDSTGPTKSSKPDSDEESDDEEETDEDELADEILQMTERRLNISSLSKDECKALNELATNYSIASGDFTKFMWEDYDEDEMLQQMREMEQEKANLAGKQSRRERKLLKEMHARMRGRYDKPPSFFGLIQPLRDAEVLKSARRLSRDKDSDDNESSSNSSHASPRGPVEKIQYITSFGDQGAGSASKKDSTSNAIQKRSLSISSNSSTSRKGRDYSKRHQTTNSKRRTRSRSRSHDRHRSSRDNRHERSERYARKDNQRYERRSYRRSVSSSSSSDSRRSPRTSHVRKGSPVASATAARRNEQRSGGSEDSESELSMLSIRSSMSESEKEERQIENRRRRLKNTKREAKYGTKRQYSGDNQAKLSTSKGKTLTLRERLALQTQKALKKTVAKDKEEESKRREELLREQMEREEEMREMTNLIRQKEREKRDREVEEETKAAMEQISKDKDGNERSGSRKRSRSSSSERTSKRKHRSSSRKRHHRSRSRSRSRSRERSSKSRHDGYHRRRYRSRSRSQSRSRSHQSSRSHEKRNHDNKLADDKKQSGTVVSTKKLVDY